MTLEKCPECNGDVSLKAAFCPHCGHPGHERYAVRVEVKDMTMSLGNMVGTLIKLVIASIPAGIILAIIGVVVMAGFTALKTAN